VRLRADEHNYSVPYRLVGESIDVRLTEDTVECFHKGQRVASHVRSHQKNGHTTLPQHMPEGHREHAKWTPERIIHWVGKAGPCAAQVAERKPRLAPTPPARFQACGALSFWAKPTATSGTKPRASAPWPSTPLPTKP
jgi:transposase